MDNDFLIRVRKLTFNLDKVTEKDVGKLEKNGYKLVKKVEDALLINSDNGEKLLTVTLREILHEYYHNIELKTDRRLKELSKNGFSDYDKVFHLTREVHDQTVVVIVKLLELTYIYFPKRARINLELYKEFDRGLANKVARIKETKSRGRKTKAFEDWKKFVKKEDRINTIINSMTRYREESSDSLNHYIPVSVVSLLQNKKWINLKKGEFAAGVRFISNKYGINSDELDDNMTRIQGAKKGIMKEFDRILNLERLQINF